MTLRVKVVNAVLTHDTEIFSNMVLLQIYRILTAQSPSAAKNIEQRPKAKQEKDQFGTKSSNLQIKTTTSKSKSWMKTP